MSKNLLLFSHDFRVDLKKYFKTHDVHLIDIHADVLSTTIHKDHKLICELVECLFKGYDKLTLITNYETSRHYENLINKRSLAFVFDTKKITKTYELNDFHASVMNHLKCHQLLDESRIFLEKELVSIKLSKPTKKMDEMLSCFEDDYEAMIVKSKNILEVYKENFISTFGYKRTFLNT